MATYSDEEVMALALDFIFQFAQQNQFFTGGDVLDAYRKAGHPDPEYGWRNTWAALITKGANTGWYVKAGRVAPKSKQSHTSSLVQWQSRLFKGVQHLTGETAKDVLEELHKAVVLRETDLRTALWKAYELGVEQGVKNE